jgi:hypothetical protein
MSGTPAGVDWRSVEVGTCAFLGTDSVSGSGAPPKF